MSTPGLLRQCGCRDATGRRLRLRCPRLTAERGHGTWYYRCYIRDLRDKAVQVSRLILTTARNARAKISRKNRRRPGPPPARPTKRAPHRLRLTP